MVIQHVLLTKIAQLLYYVITIPTHCIYLKNVKLIHMSYILSTSEVLLMKHSALSETVMMTHFVRILFLSHSKSISFCYGSQ